MLTGPVRSTAPRRLAAYGLPVERALAAYRAAYPEAVPATCSRPSQTDWWCRSRPSASPMRTPIAAAHGTYMYEFAWPAPGLGAVHALEIPFVFDTPADATLSGPMLGDAPPQELADAMHCAWVAFATTGDPGGPGTTAPRATMRFDTTSRVVDDPRSWERELWDGAR